MINGAPCALAHTEVFSPQGSKPLPFKTTNQKCVRREYDKLIKSNVVVVEGCSTQTKIQLPKDDRTSLQITHPFIVIQLFATTGIPLYFEFVFSDNDTPGRRRIILSSSVKEISHAQHHAKLPLHGIQYNKWLNLCFDLPVLIAENFKQLTLRTVDAIIFGPCKLRKVFTLRDLRAGIPPLLDFPAGTDTQSLLFVTNVGNNSHINSSNNVNRETNGNVLPPTPTSGSNNGLSGPFSSQTSPLPLPPAVGGGGGVYREAKTADPVKSKKSQQQLWSHALNARSKTAGAGGERGNSGNCNSNANVQLAPTVTAPSDALDQHMMAHITAKHTVQNKVRLKPASMNEQLISKPVIQIQQQQGTTTHCNNNTAAPPIHSGPDALTEHMSKLSPTSRQWSREQKKVSFSASTKLEDGCGWNHLMSPSQTGYETVDNSSTVDPFNATDLSLDAVSSSGDKSPFSSTVYISNGNVSGRGGELLDAQQLQQLQTLSEYSPNNTNNHTIHPLASKGSKMASLFPSASHSVDDGQQQHPSPAAATRNCKQRNATSPPPTTSTDCLPATTSKGNNSSYTSGSGGSGDLTSGSAFWECDSDNASATSESFQSRTFDCELTAQDSLEEFTERAQQAYQHNGGGPNNTSANSHNTGYSNSSAGLTTSSTTTTSKNSSSNSLHSINHLITATSLQSLPVPTPTTTAASGTTSSNITVTPPTLRSSAATVDTTIIQPDSSPHSPHHQPTPDWTAEGTTTRYTSANEGGINNNSNACWHSQELRSSSSSSSSSSPTPTPQYANPMLLSEVSLSLTSNQSGGTSSSITTIPLCEPDTQALTGLANANSQQQHQQGHHFNNSYLLHMIGATNTVVGTNNNIQRNNNSNGSNVNIPPTSPINHPKRVEGLSPTTSHHSGSSAASNTTPIGGGTSHSSSGGSSSNGIILPERLTNSSSTTAGKKATLHQQQQQQQQQRAKDSGTCCPALRSPTKSGSYSKPHSAPDSSPSSTTALRHPNSSHLKYSASSSSCNSSQQQQQQKQQQQQHHLLLSSSTNSNSLNSPLFNGIGRSLSVPSSPSHHVSQCLDNDVLPLTSTPSKQQRSPHKNAHKGGLAHHLPPSGSPLDSPFTQQTAQCNDDVLVGN